jgi:uncharacterized membrane protein
MHRLIKVATAGLVLTGEVMMGSAVGAATPVSGQTQLWASLGPGNGNGFKVVFTGAIGDHGTSVGATKNGKATKKNNPGYRLFILKKGTIFFNTKTIDAAENNNNSAPTTLNSTTCSATFVVTDPVTPISGTKAYAGIKGTIDVTISYAFTLPLDKGKCNPNTNANPSAAIGLVTGTGTVSYG